MSDVRTRLVRELERLSAERARKQKEISDLDVRINAGATALGALSEVVPARGRPPKRGKVLNPSRVAKRQAPASGKRRARNLAAKAEAAIRSAGGRATAADVAKSLRANSGSVAYALRVLEDRGVIRPTGNVVGRTREYEWVGTGRVAEPGSEG